MAIKVTETEAPLAASDLDDFERRLNITFPEEYRNFMLLHNGGRPEKSRFSYRNKPGMYADSCVDWFLAIYDGEFDNMERYFNTYKINRIRMPDELVPIAHDPGGNLICISVKGENKGTIYFWDHENESEDNEKASYRNVHFIAASHAEFIKSLKHI